MDSYGLTESCTALTVGTPRTSPRPPARSAGRSRPWSSRSGTEANGRCPRASRARSACAARSTCSATGTTRRRPRAAIDADRWLHTGDLGTVEHGRLRLSARRSDLIIRGGENVYPAEIEGALAEHPAVQECIVLGGRTTTSARRSAPWWSCAPTGRVTDAELADFLRERLAYFKVPTHWRFSTDPLPRNATGKVLRTRVEV